jgi:glycosyltransferase involved in cell wall biosynthesis
MQMSDSNAQPLSRQEPLVSDTPTRPAATVTICTRNRAESLACTLQSIVDAAAYVDEPWELLVVDNGSTDHTQKVVARFGDRLPIRSIFHPVPGLSNARNAGLADARGAVIIWTDDDLLVDEEWLCSYLKAFRAWPDHAIFGGRAVPRYDEPSNDWFKACEGDLASLLAIRDAPDWDAITPDRVPYGLNYAVRTDVQRKFPYDPDLGVAPGRRLGGEETTMIRAALAGGATGRWVWAATVYHLIPCQRQTAAYVFSYYRAHGYRFPDVSMSDKAVHRGRATVAVVGRMLRKGVMTLWRRARGHDAWVRSFIDFARSVGTVDRMFSGQGRAG